MMKAAIFDMDGTLINSLIFWAHLWKTIGEKYLQDPAFRPDENTDRECRTLTVDKAMDLVHERFGIGGSGKELTDLAVELIIVFYREVVEVKPGTLEFLQYLKDRGVKMAVATASDGDLVQLAMELDAAGKHSAYARIMDAVANYDVGNTTLAAVLDDLTQ